MTPQQILVIPQTRLWGSLPLGKFEGFREVRAEKILEIIEQHGRYVSRTDELEKDTSLKQVIPQVCLISGNHICVHDIPPTGSEARLHNMTPIFFGGHMEVGDSTFMLGADRELNEEVQVDSIQRKTIVGLVNLESPQVNSVHIGIVLVYHCANLNIRTTGDEGVSNPRFVTWEDANELLPRMSYWSQVCFPVLRSMASNDRI